MRSIAMICAAIVLAGTAASPALAQQKTVKACQEEWRANKADNQAKGITEKSYVERCRSGGTAAAPAAAPAPTRSTATPPPASTPAAPAQSQRMAPPPAATTTAPRQATTGAANQFTSEAQAKTHCPGDTVVWVNLQSHIYHFQNSRNFGKTKSGAFMCEKDADSAGNRAAKNEKKPS